MPARASLIIVLVLSLLFARQTPRLAATPPTDAKMGGCAMTTCVTGCCTQMACCVRSEQEQPHSEQAPSSNRVSLEFAALELRHFSISCVLPDVERRLAIREQAQGAHTLPRLAATCIQLI